MTIAPRAHRDDFYLLHQIDQGQQEQTEEIKQIVKQCAAETCETVKQSGAETTRVIISKCDQNTAQIQARLETLADQNAELQETIKTLALRLSDLMTQVADLKAARHCASVPATQER